MRSKGAHLFASDETMVGICLRLFAYSLPQLLQSDGDSCHVSLPRFSVTKCRSDGLLCSVSQLVCHHSLRAQARSHRVTGGSLLLRAQRPPSGLRRRCRRLPCSGDFFPGPGGLHQLHHIPSLRAAVITPPVPTTRSARVPAVGVAFANAREARPPVLVLTRLARRSIPAARKVAPGPSVRFVERHHALLSSVRVFPATWFRLLAMTGLSPARL